MISIGVRGNVDSVPLPEVSEVPEDEFEAPCSAEFDEDAEDRTSEGEVELGLAGLKRR